jgi:hypothetical protein
VESEVATGSAYLKLLSGEESFCTGKVLWGVHVQEPQTRGKATGMRNVTGLKKRLNGEHGEGLGEGRGGFAKGLEAVAVVREQADLKLGERGSVDDDWERLNKGCDGDKCDRRLGYGGVLEEQGDETWRQERQIDGKEDGIGVSAGRERSADAGQRTQAGSQRVVDQSWGNEGKITSHTRDYRLKTGIAEDRDSMLDERSAGEGDESFVLPHADGSTTGEDESAGGRHREVGQAQRPASSRKRIRERIPSSKF